MKPKIVKIMIVVSVLAVVGIWSIGCSPGEEIEMTVDHYKQPCMGMAKFLCMRVDEGDGFQIFYDHIDGFDFEWGYTYSLRVLKEDVSNPPVDGSSVKYTLEDVLNKTPIAPDTTFPLEVEYSQPELSLDDSEGGALMDGTPFACDSPEVCSQIQIGLDADQNFSVEFGYTTVNEVLSLVAQSATL